MLFTTVSPCSSNRTDTRACGIERRNARTHRRIVPWSKFARIVWHEPATRGGTNGGAEFAGKEVCDSITSCGSGTGRANNSTASAVVVAGCRDSSQ
jgi:hypothetical protein